MRRWGRVGYLDFHLEKSKLLRSEKHVKMNVWSVNGATTAAAGHTSQWFLEAVEELERELLLLESLAAS
ncbi:unnamed protein product [Nezara viridula]|uniref:Uncharacterized protein n=1 Tax=Nezara viridula TaxID=85310 RepID=A0A9P0H6D0_NEZVI|nr:unnamed protein product [Nezara viridula]